MLKKLQLIVLFTLFVVSGLTAQTVILSDEFDNGDGKWNTGWIDNASATVAVSIDNTGKLSGTNSYKLVITKGSADTYRIQRNANLPLHAGNVYTLSFMAVADKNASINALFEISGDPYTKYLNEIVEVTTTPQTFTYTVSIDANVPTNMVKLHFGGTGNDGSTIWVDAITVTEMADPTLVSKWGKASSAGAWPVLNDSSTAAGSATMGDGSAKPSGWATIRGEFDALQATTTDAVVVTGKLKLNGGGGASGYTHFRYGLTFQDSTTLVNALTDTAAWVSSKGHFGYGFQPRSGNGTMANGRGGAGTLWLVDGGGFNSGWGGNNTAAVGVNGNTVQINQAPRNAQMVEGTYNFAISVKMIDDTTSQVNWYLVESTNKYWFGGSEIVKAKTDKFNGISFGINNDSEAKQFQVMSVKATLGDDITVPEAPWESYYVDQWGKGSSAGAWPVLNDSTTLVGDATMGDGSAKPSGWATLRGAFGQNLKLKTDKELIVKGQLQFVGGGGGDAYTHFRYAMTFQDSATLKGALTDTAYWSSTKGHYGYGFQPRTGNGTMANGRGGAGTLWLVDGGGFNSGWGGNNTAAVGVNGNTVQINQAPRNAQMVAGTYDFAISVRMINDTTSQVKWYLVEENNKYWFGGDEIVKSKTDKFNGVCFALNNDSETKQFNVIAAEVDYGTITVPEAPWEKYYVDQWGKGSSAGAWPVLNDSTTLVGDATMGDGSAKPSGWATLRGAFGQNLKLKTDKELIVKGQLQFVGGGGGDAYTHFRYAMTFQDSATLKGALTDTAYWSSTKGHYGYGFQPRTGNGTMANGRGGAGTLWLVDGGGFNSGWGGNNTAAVGVNGNTVQINQAPRNAQMVAGTYDFAISVRMINDTTSQVKWYLVEENNKYWFGGDEIVKSKTDKFNGVCFALNNDSETKQFNVIAAEVDYGTITVPDAPFEPFYVADWGFIGERTGGWDLTPGEYVGDVSISGAAAVSGWSAIRGGFGGNVKPTTAKAIKLTAKMELVGGGFQDWSSLRLGLFHSDSAGVLVDSTSSWSGLERATSGYLFIPTSGTNDVTDWQGISKKATVGAVVNGTWISSNGESNYILTDDKQEHNAVAGAGTYEINLSVGPVKDDGSVEVRYYIHNADDTYQWGGIVTDNNNPLVTSKFNSFNIGLNNKTTTALNLIEVKVDMGDPIVVPEDVVSVDELDKGIPTEYALSQNYPNPFNPTTTIEFALPKAGNVKMIVYDILGRSVAELVNGNLNAGYHRVKFNASNLASGIYFYSIKADDFTNVKKLMLLK